MKVEGKQFVGGYSLIFDGFLAEKVDCGDIRRSIEQSSDVGYIVWPLIKPLLLGKILYAPATPVSNAIIAKVDFHHLPNTFNGME